jgi:hypothetical protein
VSSHSCQFNGGTATVGGRRAFILPCPLPEIFPVWGRRHAAFPGRYDTGAPARPGSSPPATAPAMWACRAVRAKAGKGAYACSLSPKAPRIRPTNSTGAYPFRFNAVSRNTPSDSKSRTILPRCRARAHTRTHACSLPGRVAGRLLVRSLIRRRRVRI